MSDNLAQLDQGGGNCQWVRINLGPTLGWVMLPVVPELEYNSTAPLTISPYTSRVLLKAACKSITLPAVKQWMLANPPQANQSAFDRSIWVKDYAYQASDQAPIVFTPNGTDTIDGLASFSMVSAGNLLRLNPLTDLTGWYLG